ncbi:MAG: chromate efflux transporter [Puniceicoccaceae bacterium]
MSELFWICLRLGLTSFGGPVAHIGYFREVFVRERRWLEEDEFAALVTLCQCLPGPSSSQLNFIIGMRRRGLAGGVVAWCGFTLPSALMLIAAGYGVAGLSDLDSKGWILGLKLAAVAVVAKALLEMGLKHCRNGLTISFALFATALLLLVNHPLAAPGCLLIFGWFGWALLPVRSRPTLDEGLDYWREREVGTGRPLFWLGLFFGLFLILPLLAMLLPKAEWLAWLAAFYRAGGLVFGGGHVILPLLEPGVVGVGWIDRSTFLAGYGMAQAVPGPLLTFAAYLGSVFESPSRLGAGLFCLVAVFLPSLFLVVGILPYWNRLSRWSGFEATLAGMNAAVVGVLLAAFYDPVLIHSVTTPSRFGLALIAFGAIGFCKVPTWAMVPMAACAGALWFG